MSEFNKFEEYKLFVEDTARLSDRRQTISNIYVTVNSILSKCATKKTKYMRGTARVKCWKIKS